MPRRKLLWVGDAGVATGFARATHHTLDVLRHSWDVSVLGINYLGDPHVYPYDIYPAYAGGDAFGTGRLAPLAKALEVDLVVLQTDPWLVPAYLKTLLDADCRMPVVGTLAVDGKNCQGQHLNGLAHAIFWTAFARREALEGGYLGPSAVVPLGVDLNVYEPVDRLEARRTLGVTETLAQRHSIDAFTVGTINRNQQRKRFDLMAEYFCDWIEQRAIADAYLLVHTCPTGDSEYDLAQYFTYRGVRDRLVLIVPNVGQGIPEPYLKHVYSSLDVYVSTSQGEGWGLPAMEAMACGVPCLLPDWAAYGEWATGAACLVPCPSTAWTQRRINVIGGIADRVQWIEGLDRIYRDTTYRRELAAAGLACARQPAYRWPAIGRAFAEVLDTVVPNTQPSDAEWADLGRPVEAVA
jgi:D-inositol-3-phosphate glycosyltransferase